MICEEVGNLKT